MQPKKFLLLKDNPGVSNISFLTELPKLKFTDIRNTNATRDEVERVRESLPNTRILAFNDRKFKRAIKDPEKYNIDNRIRQRLKDFEYLR